MTTAPRRFRPYLIWTATVLVGIALAVFFAWLFESERAARATCAAFVAAVREDRLVDARTLVSPELEPSLEGTNSPEDARRLLRAAMPEICEGSP